MLFPFVQSVRPFLHHGATLIEIGGVVVGTTHIVLVSMGKLRFDGIGTVAHLVKAGTAGGPRGVWAIGAAPPQNLERLAKRCGGHRGVAIIPARKQVLAVAGNGMQSFEHVHCLTW
ncbi:hypothetical protein D9M69_615920 [compost metagenome]